jgi:hypothetical protein
MSGVTQVSNSPLLPSNWQSARDSVPGAPIKSVAVSTVPRDTNHISGFW